MILYSAKSTSWHILYLTQQVLMKIIKLHSYSSTERIKQPMQLVMEMSGYWWKKICTSIEFLTLTPPKTCAIQYGSHNSFIDWKLHQFSSRVWDEYDYLPDRLLLMIYKISIARLVIASKIDSIGRKMDLKDWIKTKYFSTEKRRQYMQSVMETSRSWS